MADMIDRKILYQLDINCRLSNTRIAKNLRISRNVVNYRVKKLEEDGIIRGYFTEINNSALGLIGYRIFIKYSNYDAKREETLLREFLKDKRVAWCLASEGKWDIDVIFWCHDRFEFYTLISELKDKHNDFIERISYATIVDIYHYRKDYLIGNKREYPKAVKFGKISYNINKKEKMLLGFLSNNARKDIIKLSKETGMSINTITKMIKNLVKNNMILGFRPFIDIDKLGYQYFRLHLWLRNYTHKQKKSLITYLELDSNVVYLDFYIGGADIEIEYHVPTDFVIFKKLDNMKKRFGDIIGSYEIIRFTKEYVVCYMPEI